MDFIKKILSFESSNLVFAPSNIFHAFGLLLDGAQDQTEREIVSILGQGKQSHLLLPPVIY
jgi:serine protease inhibitor